MDVMGRLGRAAKASALFVSIGTALALIPACGSTSNNDNADAGAAAFSCDNTKCKTNNHCIKTASDEKCRFPCKAHLDCPFNYHCDANADGSEPFCVADTNPKQKSDKGLWGASCQPNLGILNPACDDSQGFYCHANSPTDGAAFCTTYDCATDADCGHGFYCGKTNKKPNAKTLERSDHETDSVCLPREYCAPCGSDIDCGANQRCVQDKQGGLFCSNECATDANCRADAKCTTYGDFKACLPRAGQCVGDGSFCSPCHSDADCPNGYCFEAAYSPEKFCTVKSGKTCTLDANQKLVADCPKAVAPNSVVGCTYPAAAQDGEPLNQCVGYVLKGTGQEQGYVPGCWTKQ